MTRIKPGAVSQTREFEHWWNPMPNYALHHAWQPPLPPNPSPGKLAKDVEQ